MNRCNVRDEFTIRIGRITMSAIPSSNLKVWRLRSSRMVGIGRLGNLTDCRISSSVFCGLALAGNNAWQWIMPTFVKHINIVLLHFTQRSTKNRPFHLVIIKPQAYLGVKTWCISHWVEGLLLPLLEIYLVFSLWLLLFKQVITIRPHCALCSGRKYPVPQVQHESVLRFSCGVSLITVQSQYAHPNGTPLEMGISRAWFHQLSLEISNPFVVFQ